MNHVDVTVVRFIESSLADINRAPGKPMKARRPMRVGHPVVVVTS